MGRTDGPLDGLRSEPASDGADLRAQFPIRKTRNYLDTASIGPLSDNVVAAVGRFMSDARDHGGRNYAAWRHHVEGKVRGQVAALLGARPSEIAFVKNTTEGILIVANGIDWREGDNVIVPDIEYPSNVYCWLNLARRGVSVKWLKAAGGRLPVEQLQDLIDSRTRLVTLSAVQFSNGYRQDLARTADLCRKRGVLLNVDGAQWIGALAIDLSQYPIDFLSTGGHKWLHAPIGTGFFYCARNRLADLIPANIGYHSVQKDDDHLDYQLVLRDDASRFEEALINLPGLVGLGAALELLLSMGGREIERHVLKLSRALIEGLRARGHVITSPLGDGERSAIVTFRHATTTSADIVGRLAAAGIDVAERIGAVRAAPSVLNDEQDIAALLEALPR